MPTLFEAYTTEEDLSWGPVSSSVWAAQIFTPRKAHRISEVRLVVFKVTGRTPGTITVSIRAVSGSGDDAVPTGADLATGTYDGNSLPDGLPVQTITIPLGASVTLNANTSYAICVRCASATADIGLSASGASNPYPRGLIADSSNSGVAWNTNPNYDLLFQEWGEADTLLHFAVGGKTSAGVVAARNG